jgi:putative acetyltransferase
LRGYIQSTSGKFLINLRVENPEDRLQVRTLNQQAFNQPVEADLVDKLRQTCSEYLSLVAEDGNLIVGHILFTPVVIEGAGRNLKGMGLAPMAVMPDRQRQGIGSMLVRRGVQILHDQGCPLVVVLGHPQYYLRFGSSRLKVSGFDRKNMDRPRAKAGQQGANQC